MNLVLHIDRIVMDGLSVNRTQLPAVRDALERELARLVGSAGLDSVGGARSIGRIATPPVGIDPQPRPVEVGRQLARSIHGSLRGGR